MIRCGSDCFYHGEGIGLRDDEAFERFVEDFHGTVFEGCWENQFVVWCYRNTLRALPQAKWDAVAAPATRWKLYNGLRPVKVVEDHTAHERICCYVQRASAVPPPYSMQTNPMQPGGAEPSDLLSAIYDVKVRNEEKITEPDRLYGELQQDELYKTLEHLGEYSFAQRCDPRIPTMEHLAHRFVNIGIMNIRKISPSGRYRDTSTQNGINKRPV